MTVFQRNRKLLTGSLIQSGQSFRRKNGEYQSRMIGTGSRQANQVFIRVVRHGDNQSSRNYTRCSSVLLLFFWFWLYGRTTGSDCRIDTTTILVLLPGGTRSSDDMCLGDNYQYHFSTRIGMVRRLSLELYGTTNK